MATRKSLNRSDYIVGWLCALEEEATAARWMLDNIHNFPIDRPDISDHNSYKYGDINSHNVIIARMPSQSSGKAGATWTALHLTRSFPHIRIYLFVGIGGGVPINPFAQDIEGRPVDIHVGDVVVNSPKYSGVAGTVEHDRGRSTPAGFVLNGIVDQTSRQLVSIVDTIDDASKEVDENHFDRHLQRLSHARLNGLVTFNSRMFQHPGLEKDVLCTPESVHDKADLTCSSCPKASRHARESTKPIFHRGPIASGDTVMQNGMERDRKSAEAGNAICFETEAAGVMFETHCLVIRGISDYADSHKGYNWHNYAAATAAAFAREVLEQLPPAALQNAPARPLSIQTPSALIMTPTSSNDTTSPIAEAPDNVVSAKANSGRVRSQVNTFHELGEPRVESAWGRHPPSTPPDDNGLRLERLYVRDDEC